MKYASWFSLFVVASLSASCGGGSGGVNNTANTTEEEVGKLIFEDTRLSANNNQSCATCHSLSATAGFADPNVTATAPVSEGSITGLFGERNAPTTGYAKFAPAFAQINDPVRGLIYAGGQFIDGRRNTLEEQAKDPFLNPLEMANTDKLAVVQKVQNGPYADKFIELYGSDVFNSTDTAYDHIAEAIAAFERSAEMNPFTSKFDCYLQNPSSYPLTAQEQSGLQIFEDPNQGKCANCHTTTPDPISGRVLFTNFQYFNIGVPSNPNNPANIADANFVDSGLGGRLAVTAENGKFKTPTLRNIELTAPYMHNGVHATLDKVIQHYDIDVANEYITPEVNQNIATELGAGTYTGLGLQPEDYQDLIAFMKTLTDGTGVGICF
ncbi:MAG TPA: cytochrome c peroxidase [Gammaproteobacteria bacterium]